MPVLGLGTRKLDREPERESEYLTNDGRGSFGKSLSRAMSHNGVVFVVGGGVDVAMGNGKAMSGHL